MLGFFALAVPLSLIFYSVSNNFFYDVFFYHSTKPLVLNSIFVSSFFAVYLVRYFPFLILGFPVLIDNLLAWKKLKEKEKIFNLWCFLGFIFILASRAWNTEAAINLYTISIFLPFTVIVSNFKQYKKLVAVVLIFWFFSSVYSIYNQIVFDFQVKEIFSKWAEQTGKATLLGPIPTMTLANFPGKKVIPKYLDLDFSRFNAGQLKVEEIENAVVENNVSYLVAGDFNSKVYPWKGILDYCCTLNDTKKVFAGTELETTYNLYKSKFS